MPRAGFFHQERRCRDRVRASRRRRSCRAGGLLPSSRACGSPPRRNPLQLHQVDFHRGDRVAAAGDDEEPARAACSSSRPDLRCCSRRKPTAALNEAQHDHYCVVPLGTLWADCYWSTRTEAGRTSSLPQVLPRRGRAGLRGRRTAGSHSGTICSAPGKHSCHGARGTSPEDIAMQLAGHKDAVGLPAPRHRQSHPPQRGGREVRSGCGP